MRFPMGLRTSAAAALTALLVTLNGASAMACMSHTEWDQVELSMSVQQVRTIADGPGTESSVHTSGPHNGEYSVDWPACWDDTKKVRGWFNDLSDLLVDKNVIDR